MNVQPSNLLGILSPGKTGPNSSAKLGKFSLTASGGGSSRVSSALGARPTAGAGALLQKIECALADVGGSRTGGADKSKGKKSGISERFAAGVKEGAAAGLKKGAKGVGSKVVSEVKKEVSKRGALAAARPDVLFGAVKSGAKKGVKSAGKTVVVEALKGGVKGIFKPKSK